MNSLNGKYKVSLEEARLLIAAQKAIKDKRYTTAVEYYEQVLKGNPKQVLALHNMAVIAEYVGEGDVALDLYGRIIKAEPTNASAHYSKALIHLHRGHLRQGWEEYKWRQSLPNRNYLFDKFLCPVWDGEPLTGKKVVIWTEQGIGEELLLGTMLNELMEETANYTIVCSPRMMPVFGRTFPKCRIVNRDVVLANTYASLEYDYQISLVELGMYLRNTWDDFPKWGAYLDWDTALSKQMREKYKAGTDNMLIGIAWHSNNPKHEGDKSIPFNEWEGVLATPNCTFVSLQYGDARKDVVGSDVIVDPTVDPLTNMDRAVAQVAAMDMVISVSSTPVHIAGALGIPVWNIIPNIPIWYWHKGRTDSPWYKSMNIFKRDKNGTVMPQVEKALIEYLNDGQSV